MPPNHGKCLWNVKFPYFVLSVKKKKKMAMVKVMVGSVTDDSDNLKDDEIVANEKMTMITTMNTVTIIMITVKKKKIQVMIMRMIMAKKKKITMMKKKMRMDIMVSIDWKE